MMGPVPVVRPSEREGIGVRRRLVGAVVLGVLAVGAAACGSDDGGGGEGAATTTTAVAEPVDYATRGPYAVGEVDLQLDEDHAVAVFYPVDRDAVADDATPYSYSGEDILGPEVVSLLPGALAGEIAPPDTWVDVPASPDGPFPVVLHSHGAAGNLRFANLHNSHVASWGFVVVAVDHPERGLGNSITSSLGGAATQDEELSCEEQLTARLERDEDDPASDPDLDRDQLAEAFALVVEESGTGGSPLEGTVDAENVAAEGHSAGGQATGSLAYDGDVDLWIGQAPTPPIPGDVDVTEFISVEEVEGDDGETTCDFNTDVEGLLAEVDPPPVPSLIIAAEGDEVVPVDGVETIYEWLEAPKRLVVIEDSGHAVFVDPCQPIHAEGGLTGFVEALGLDPDEVPLVRLGEDGCLPEDTPAETVWSFIDHVTVAQLNETFGIDAAAATASLDPGYLAETFPERFGSEQSEP